MKSKILFALFAVILSFGAASVSEAQVSINRRPVLRPSPVPGPIHRPDMVTAGNLWRLTGYRDAFRHTPYPVKQGLCYFYLGRQGSHDLYAWISTTHYKWWGFAEKEGDQVTQFGNFAPRSLQNTLSPWWRVNWRGHSSMQFELVSRTRRRGHLVPRDMATGHGQAYIEPGIVRVFANIKMVRIGKCLPHIATQIKGVMEVTGGIGANGDVRITDELVEVLKDASALAPQRKKNNGAPEDFPFSMDIAPLDIPFSE